MKPAPFTYHDPRSVAEALDFVIPEGLDPNLDHPFKGNVDLHRLEAFLAAHRERVPLVIVTVTNNSGGGQPVSLENLRAVRALTKRFGVPLFLDCARFAENAWLIKQREPGQHTRSARDIRATAERFRGAPRRRWIDSARARVAAADPNGTSTTCAATISTGGLPSDPTSNPSRSRPARSPAAVPPLPSATTIAEGRGASPRAICDASSLAASA